ncbi:PREDICTED: rhodanese-like/PpiC domain-containing protein 12, chloroplastic [Camelina sativa]|uniref:Rhodanese-like/PpiC domain-containing protein 12, chloroplastic n=1 Tax=Camelina sativa TaxID=90675 RepID=A0ABM0T4F6_CAMSA|nr:PREDICTED: rhodanese-like/PpiC domain-containing protein 12, chloroplastic [Camelina sativa]
MFRVTGTLSAVSSPAVVAASYSAVLRLSVTSTLAIVSPPNPRWFSTFSRSFLGGRISSLRPPRVPSPCPIRLSGFSALKMRASFSSSGSSPGREILVQHLLVNGDDTELFAELQKKILDGEDMNDLAAEYSICPSKKDSGILGWVKLGQMVPEFEEAAFKAELNQVVRCRTQFGLHLLQVLSEREPVKDIQVEELHSKMQDPVFMDEAQLIDVREPDEIAIASLPGFKVFPLRQFGTWAPDITSKLNPEKDVFVMCKVGGRSMQVANWLQSQGFKSVYNVAGGIQAYSLKVDPSIPTY